MTFPRVNKNLALGIKGMFPPHTARAVCQQEEEHEVHISSATQVGMCFSPGGNLYFKHISVLELKACVFVYKTHAALWHR